MKQWVISSLLAFSSVAVMAASSLDDRIGQLEKEMQDVLVKTSSGTSGANFGSSAKTQEGGAFLSFDVLYWHAKSGGVDWALVTDSAVLPYKGKLQTLGFDWDFGFRVGLGKKFESHDNWDIGLEYTWFKTADGNKRTQAFTTPVGTNAPEGNSGPSGSSTGAFTANIKYDNLDLDLGRVVFSSSRFSMHPHFGLRSSWINQRQRLYTENYIDAQETFLPAAGNVDTNLFSRCDFWGIGIKAGTDASFHFTKNLKFLGLLEGSILQGYFDVEENQWLGVTPSGQAQVTTTTEMSANTRKYIPTARLMLGLGYGSFIRDNKNYIDISLSYEVNYFWRVNQFLNTGGSVPANINITDQQSVRLMLDRLSEDLSFYGVTFKLRYQF